MNNQTYWQGALPLIGCRAMSIWNSQRVWTTLNSLLVDAFVYRCHSLWVTQAIFRVKVQSRERSFWPYFWWIWQCYPVHVGYTACFLISGMWSIDLLEVLVTYVLHDDIACHQIHQIRCGRAAVYRSINVVLENAGFSDNGQESVEIMQSCPNLVGA